MRDRFDFSQRRADDPRHSVSFPATIEAGGHLQPGQVVNLSRGGLALRFVGVLDPGAPVRVTLHLPSGADLPCEGRVAWVDRAFQVGAGSAGVAFKQALQGDRVADLAAAELPLGGVPPDASLGDR